MDAKPSPATDHARTPEERRAKEEAQRRALWRIRRLDVSLLRGGDGGSHPRTSSNWPICPPRAGAAQVATVLARYPGRGWRAAGTPTREPRTGHAPSRSRPAARHEARCGRAGPSSEQAVRLHRLPLTTLPARLPRSAHPTLVFRARVQPAQMVLRPARADAQRLVGHHGVGDVHEIVTRGLRLPALDRPLQRLAPSDKLRSRSPGIA